MNIEDFERKQDEFTRDIAAFIGRHPYLCAALVIYHTFLLFYIDLMRS